MDIQGKAEIYADITSPNDREERYFNGSKCDKYDSFVAGAEWMQDQYNGLTPETVTILVNQCNIFFYKQAGNNITKHNAISELREILQQVNKELTK